jgi:ribosomal protein L44E
VQAKERKCPNCGKHYEVSRVEEYKQSRMTPNSQTEARVEPVEEIPKPKNQGDKSAA